MKIEITVDLTPWWKASPSDVEHWLRSWSPESPLMRDEGIGLAPEERGTDPHLYGAAASVRDEYPNDVTIPRFSWQIWTPIGSLWAYRSGRSHSAATGMAAADEALVELARMLGATPVTESTGLRWDAPGSDPISDIRRAVYGDETEQTMRRIYHHHAAGRLSRDDAEMLCRIVSRGRRSEPEQFHPIEDTREGAF